MSDPHRFPTWNYWEDTGASGIVYYANYLRFPERGRCDLVREAVIDQVALLDTEGVMLPLQHCEINFLRPAHLDDQMRCAPESRRSASPAWRWDRKSIEATTTLSGPR